MEAELEASTGGATGRPGGRALTIAIALGMLAAIAIGMYGVPAAKSAVDGCTDRDLDVGIVKAKGCWTISGTKYTTTRPVDLNGFTVTPSTTAPFTIDTDVQNRVATTNGKPVGIAANPIKYQNMPLNFRIPSTGQIPIGGATIPPGYVLAGFPLVVNAQTQIILTEGQGAVDLPIQLFSFLTVIGKQQSVTVHSAVIPGQGLKYDGVDIDVNGLVMKPIPFGIENLHAQYSLSQDSWGGSATLVFPWTPKPFGEETEKGVTFGAHFAQGKFVDAHLGAVNLGLPIGGGVLLQKVDGTVAVDPAISGTLTVGVTAGKQFRIFGRDVSAAAVDGSLTIRGARGTTPGMLGLGGNVALVGLPVADASLNVYFNGSADFNARAGFGLPSFNNDPSQPFFLGGQFSGWMAATGFNVSASAQLKLFDTQVAGASAVVSDRGLGACAEVHPFWFTVSLGFGYSFQSQTATPYFAGCDLGPYQDWNRPTSRLSQGHIHHARASLGPKHKVLRIEGANDVPGFTLSDDDGTTITHDADDEDGHTVDETPPDGAADDSTVIDDSHMVIPNETADEAIVLLGEPEGEWTIDEAPGSEIVSVQRASTLRKERVDAEVRGHGRRRTLVWDAREFDGQRLQFHERVGKGVLEPILNTAKASGRYRFTPKQGGFYGNRKFEVQVLQQGTPRAEKVVDNYKVTKPPLPRRPDGLSVDRHGHDVSARWIPSPDARAHVVVLESADGELRFSKQLGRSRDRASFQDTPLSDHMVVKVFALNRDEEFGRPAKRRFDVG